MRAKSIFDVNLLISEHAECLTQTNLHLWLNWRDAMLVILWKIVTGIIVKKNYANCKIMSYEIWFWNSLNINNYMDYS